MYVFTGKEEEATVFVSYVVTLPLSLVVSYCAEDRIFTSLNFSSHIFCFGHTIKHAL